MKGISVALLFLLFAYEVSFAQGFTFAWSGGYAWAPGSGQYIPGPYINTQMPTIDKLVNLVNSSDADGSYQAVKNSYGHGFNIGLRFGYMINPYIGVDLGVYYAQSTSIGATQIHSIYLPDSGVLQNTGGYMNCDISTMSRSLTLSPSIFAAYSKPGYKFYPYARFGLTLPVLTQITHTDNITLVGIGSFNYPPYYYGALTNVIMQTNGGFTVGLNGAIGVVFRAYPFLNFFAEINGQYMNLKATSSVITQWEADGQDESRGVYRTFIDYVPKLTSSSNNAQYNSNYNPNAPKQDISPQFPFSNIGFNLGIRILLNKKIFRDLDAFDEMIKAQQAKKKKKKPEEPSTTEPEKPGTATPEQK